MAKATFPRKKNYRKAASVAKAVVKEIAPLADDQVPVEEYTEEAENQGRAPAPRQQYQPRPAAPVQAQQDGEFRIISPLYHSPKSVTTFLNDKPYGKKAPNYDVIMEFLAALLPGDMIGVKDDGEKAYLYAIYNNGNAPAKTTEGR